jgi:hypothetical protein
MEEKTMKKYCIINGNKYYIKDIIFVWRYEKKKGVTFEEGGWAVLDESEIFEE